MTAKKATKKRNPAAATMRNITALKNRVVRLERYASAMHAVIKKLLRERSK